MEFDLRSQSVEDDAKNSLEKIERVSTRSSEQHSLNLLLMVSLENVLIPSGTSWIKNSDAAASTRMVRRQSFRRQKRSATQMAMYAGTSTAADKKLLMKGLGCIWDEFRDRP